MARTQGKRCRQLGGSKRLGRATSCSKRKFLKAKVKSLGRGRYRWSFTISRGLPRGRYLALVRSVDHARNLERRKQAPRQQAQRAGLQGPLSRPRPDR